MSVLYRIYRPSKWSEVIGQDQVVSPLKEAIANKNIAHAYLFSGGRGTGKTSIARIFAKAIGTNEEDIYEIDAASNRGIDDIRSLREHVSVLPFSSEYKVYIIDEVHMLSKDAWNALLKTLEEPPKHVIFILATTELDKVPDTIISRCQTFAFRKPSREIIRKMVLDIAKKEGFEIDAGGGDLIALLGDGSFRDALGMLQKVISTSGDKKISREEVEAITGAPKALLVNDYIEALLMKDCNKALSVLNNVEKSGISVGLYAMLVLEKARFILLAQHSLSSKNMIKEHVSPDDFVFIEKISSLKAITPDVLVELIGATDAVGRSRIEILPLELATVRVCSK
jgi:DNA polymerase-3 subunit gamma/tau